MVSVYTVLLIPSFNLLNTRQGNFYCQLTYIQYVSFITRQETFHKLNETPTNVSKALFVLFSITIKST